MYVIKRDGRRQDVHFDKITARVVRLSYGLNSDFCDPVLVAQKVAAGVYRGVTTAELDELAAETAASLVTMHPDYATLAARIAISNLHKNTAKSFYKTIEMMYKHRSPHCGSAAPLVSTEVMDIVSANAERLDNELRHDRDFDYDYFGFKTLVRSYLSKINGRIVERPQHMLLRVSIGIHGDDIDAAIKTYHLLSGRWFTHASPTLFNAGTEKPQMSSCFLVAMKNDSIDGIYDTLKECAIISKNAGGIGVSMHDIRATGSYIHGTNGTSNGIVPMLRVFNDTARYVDQGGGKRKGAFAMYLEPWHADIMDFLDLRKNHGKEETRTRDLFLALWISDLFMRRVEADSSWSLFCPNEAPGLSNLYGEEFDALYERYERDGRARKTIRAQSLWFAIVDAQIETGTPYMLYKDSCNRKSNQKNLGTIKCSNLCTEIIQWTSPEETAVCNLASIALPRFINQQQHQQQQYNLGSLDAASRVFDFTKLGEVVEVVVENLNKIIDRNYYPVETARLSNMKHRPIGLGVQGLADVFILLGMPFDSPEAAALNRDIFECIYYHALKASCRLAQRDGTYETYQESPTSQGILQQDMWTLRDLMPRSVKLNWETLRASIAQHGLRNSLLVAPMPTASTSQILGNNECFEPYTSNIYVRRVLSGEFMIVNTHLLADLVRLNLWSPEVKNEILKTNGSVQTLDIPDKLKEIYKTVWEIKQRVLVDMAADRGAYIDQSQSLNIFLSEPTANKLTSLHFYAWKQGLKTGMYYLRTRPAVDAIKFTVNVDKIDSTGSLAKSSNTSNGVDSTDHSLASALKCSRDNKDSCMMCGS